MVTDHQRRVTTGTFTRTEKIIYDFICDNPSATRQQIQDAVYGRLRVRTKVVQVHLSRIRAKLYNCTDKRLIGFRSGPEPTAPHCYQIITIEPKEGSANGPTIIPTVLP